jgi:hypothetical protein
VKVGVGSGSALLQSRTNEQQQNRCREFPFDSDYKELNTNASPLTSQRNNYLCRKVEKSKSRKVDKSKTSKSRKVEKSKSRKRRKVENVENVKNVENVENVQRQIRQKRQMLRASQRETYVEK